MNPIIFALRHPITVMVAVASLVVGSALAVLPVLAERSRMKVDVFCSPSVDQP